MLFFRGPLPSVGLLVCNTTFSIVSLLCMPFRKARRTALKKTRTAQIVKPVDATQTAWAQVSAAADEEPAPTPPPSPSGEVSRLSRITLARKHIVCSSKSKYVHVPLARMGNASTGIKATVKLLDGISGKLGADYEEFLNDGKCERDTEKRVAHLTFDPSTRLSALYIPIAQKPKLAPGDSGAAEFTICLVGAETINGEAVLVGPVNTCTVRIVDPDIYPNNLDLLAVDVAAAKAAEAAADGDVFKDLKDPTATARQRKQTNKITEIEDNSKIILLFWNWLVRCFRIKGNEAPAQTLGRASFSSPPPLLPETTH